MPIKAALIGTCCVLLVACGGAKARKDRYLERGHELWAAGRFEDARIAFRNALYIAPEDTEVRVLAGEAAEKAARLREAVDLYRQAINADSRQLRARARLGQLYALAGDSETALAIIEPGLALAPDDPDLLTVRGVAKLRNGDHVGAREDAQRAVDIAPSNENAVALLAALHRRSQQTGEAIAIVERAVEAKPASIGLRLILAQLFSSAGRGPEAQMQRTEAMKLEPGRSNEP